MVYSSVQEVLEMGLEVHGDRIRTVDRHVDVCSLYEALARLRLSIKSDLAAGREDFVTPMHLRQQLKRRMA